jgi:thioredoxin 1
MVGLVEVTDSTFQKEVLESDVPVMLDLWAEWCEPCKKLGQVLDQIASPYLGRMKFCRMNVAANPRTVARYHVMNLPTILFIHDGKVVGQHVGAARPMDLSEKIDGQLAFMTH